MLSSDGKKMVIKSIGLISKKKKKNFARTTHFFFLHFFDVVLHDYYVKLSSQTSLICGKCLMCSPEILLLMFQTSNICVFFFVFFFAAIPFYLHLAGCQHSSFLTTSFHVFLPTKFVSVVFYLTCQLFLSYPHH